LRFFPSGIGLEPVVKASRLTAETSCTEGRLSTHSPLRMMFSAGFENAEIPIMQRHPSQKIEEMGATLNEPSSLQVVIRTTGVPKYNISGSLILCMVFFYYNKTTVTIREIKPDSC
jgi:hypothetical protein